MKPVSQKRKSMTSLTRTIDNLQPRRQLKIKALEKPHRRVHSRRKLGVERMPQLTVTVVTVEIQTTALSRVSSQQLCQVELLQAAEGQAP